MPLYFTMSTGFLLAEAAEGSVGIAGTCACYQRREVLVTAAHCVPADASAFYAVLPGEPKPRRILQVERHDTSDLAVVHAEPQEDEALGTQVFAGVDETLVEGGDFKAFGYPVEAAASPVGRLLKGHFQRYMSYEDAAGLGYLRRPPRTVPAPPTRTAQAPRRRVDQPAQPGGPHPEHLNDDCLKPLDTFRRAVTVCVSRSRAAHMSGGRWSQARHPSPRQRCGRRCEGGTGCE